MWANAQRDGRPAEHSWHPVLYTAKFGSGSLLECHAVTLPIGQRKTWRTQSVMERQLWKMYIYSTSAGKGQTLWKVWLASVERRRCGNKAKTRKLLKLAGVPQTNKMISAATRLKFTILWGHVEEILLLNKFFFRLSICALVAKI